MFNSSLAASRSVLSPRVHTVCTHRGCSEKLCPLSFSPTHDWKSALLSSSMMPSSWCHSKSSFRYAVSLFCVFLASTFLGFGFCFSLLPVDLGRWFPSSYFPELLSPVLIDDIIKLHTACLWSYQPLQCKVASQLLSCILPSLDVLLDPFVLVHFYLCRATSAVQRCFIL